ncbi:MAG: diguanylate cyclase [Alphaproteobacteria bacterium]|nr:diguanylate cyclase [Alphaproteobacteria bacterium]
MSKPKDVSRAVSTGTDAMDQPSPQPRDSAQVARDYLQDFAVAMGGWFWETDAELRFTYFSPSVEDITGVPAEWHYGKTREDFSIPESVAPEVWEAHLECLRRREPFTDFVFQRRATDGVKWMRTSGLPVFDEAGEFQGYRGAASDITAEMEAKLASDRLINAIENLQELFVLWGPDDRLVVCNQGFREINAKVIETVQPGRLFEDHIRTAMAAGLYPGAAGQEEAWIQDRLERHRNPGAPYEMQRQDGRWIMLAEQRLPDGSTTTISTDITQRKRAEQALTEKHEILETALTTIPDGVQVLDSDLQLVAWNDRLFEVLELDRDAIIGTANPGQALRRALAEQGEDDVQTAIEAQEATARTSAPIQYEQRLASGKWMECRGHPIASGGYLAVYRDIDESKRLYDRLEYFATTDALTEVANRRSFLDRAEAEFDRAKRYHRNVSILMIDVDQFKTVNDQHGHAVGDDVLSCTAAACREALRDSDILGRVGGEEFAALLPEAGAETAHLVAERLRLAVAGLSIKGNGGAISASVSIGVSTAAKARGNLNEIMAEADEALYEAKRQGRNRVVHFSGSDMGVR